MSRIEKRTFRAPWSISRPEQVCWPSARRMGVAYCGMPELLRAPQIRRRTGRLESRNANPERGAFSQTWIVRVEFQTFLTYVSVINPSVFEQICNITFALASAFHIPLLVRNPYNTYWLYHVHIGRMHTGVVIALMAND